jgi:GntR family transcriptional regulator, galactonate operon transcriptional repressor
LDWQAIEAGTLRPVGAAAILGRRIVSGELIPGTTLPNLDDLAVQFSVSRLSMREAIKLLAGKGLVSSAPRRGTVVRPRNEWSRLDPDVLIWQIGDIPNAAFVRNLFELRRMVEPEASALAAERASSETMAGIEQAFARMAAAEFDKMESISADFAFHQRILEGTGNEFIAALAPAIETSLMLTFTIQRGAWPNPVSFLPSHHAVLAAIQRGDAEGARRAMQALLVRSEADAIDGLRLLGADTEAGKRAGPEKKRSVQRGPYAAPAPRA